MKVSIFHLKYSKGGFLLVELLTIVGILAILAALAISSFRYFERGSGLKNEAGEIIGILRIAQNKTLASEGADQWGVYFSSSTNPQQYILFRGANYASRNPSFDEPHSVTVKTELYQTDLGGGDQVVFDRITGRTSFPGSFSLRLKTDPSRVETVYVESSGMVGLVSPSVPSEEDRLTDSRHVHFDYSRLVATSTETIKFIFTFDGQEASTTIGIANNLKNGQIFWEGEISAGGETQKIEIRTHRLNNPDTQFSVHRDLRYNTKALSLEISGDASGNLISYDVNGQTTKGVSIYAANPAWQ
ncbi:MAG: hypothetical protein HY443_01980 [Candidatus Nealsonbacteria bacterium]|nr:hypothetical protein [Candidatus Nealsonbacteria bacterium]